MLRLLAALAWIHMASAAIIQPIPPTVQQHEVSKDAYIVLLAPAMDHASFTAQLASASIDCKKRATFSTLLHAISIECSGADTAQLGVLQGVQAIYPLLKIRKPRVIKRDVTNPLLKFVHGVTGVKSVHDSLRHTGKGIRIGVLDTGIDYRHPALGGCFGKGCKIAYGYDFVGDDFDEGREPVPDADPMDTCVGHGTHVAGILAAKDKDFVGVAPDAVLGNYRVLSCHDYTTSDVIIAALERAYHDGMDIVNLSLGIPNAWSDYPSCRAANALADKGVVVVAAMGNQGESGLWLVSSPAVAENALAVASYDNVRYMALGFSVDGTNHTFDYVVSNQQLKLDVSKAPMVHVPFNKDCVPGAVDVKGKVVLAASDMCSTDNKASRLQGALAVVLYNSAFGEFTPKVQNSSSIAVPVVGVTQKTGWRLLELMNATAITITSSKEPLVFDNPSGGRVSLFSTWGPGAELELKPDVGAPGGLVYSAFPLNKGGYATLSGTSMASPYVAASIALYMQARGKQTPQQIADTFRLTAQPTTPLNARELESVFKQGSGLIQVKDAIECTTSITPTKLPLLSSDFKTGKLKAITITNNGKYPLRYVLSHRAALAVDPWDQHGEVGAPAFHNVSMGVEIATKQLVLGPGQSTKVNVFFSAPPVNLDKRWIFSGYIVVTPKSTEEDAQRGLVVRMPSLSIPYGGMHGIYKTVALLPQEDSPIVYAPLNQETFSMKTEDDTPYIMTRFIMPVKLFYLDLLDAMNRTLGRIPTSEQVQVGRGNYYSLMWNGTYLHEGTPAKVTSGTYRAKATAIGAFAAQQIRYTPPITVDWDKAPPQEDGDGTEAAPPSTPAIVLQDDSVLPQRIHFVPQV